MSKRDKLLEKVRRNPKDVTFKELDQLLQSFGYELMRTKGSHSIYRRPGAAHHRCASPTACAQ